MAVAASTSTRWLRRWRLADDVRRLRTSCSTYRTSPAKPTIGLTYRDRRRLLELLELNGPAWCTVPSFDAEADEVLEECARLRLEGLVAKRVDSRYEPGKRSTIKDGTHRPPRVVGEGTGTVEPAVLRLHLVSSRYTCVGGHAKP